MSTKDIPAWFVDAKIDPQGCWEYKGAQNKDGYGRGLSEGTYQLAHRRIYEAFVGQIPSGLCVLHHCDNPPCCRPSHLFLGTRTDNAKDKLLKMRQARGASSGARRHPELVPRGEHVGSARLTEEQVQKIRNLRKAGMCQRELALLFKISRPNISYIVRNKTWTHI